MFCFTQFLLELGLSFASPPPPPSTTPYPLPSTAIAPRYPLPLPLPHDPSPSSPPGQLGFPVSFICKWPLCSCQSFLAPWCRGVDSTKAHAAWWSLRLGANRVCHFILQVMAAPTKFRLVSTYSAWLPADTHFTVVRDHNEYSRLEDRWFVCVRVRECVRVCVLARARARATK